MKTFFRYSKHGSKNRVSVAGIHDEETLILYIGAARCSNNDQFCKKIGRNKAFGRALKSKAHASDDTEKGLYVFGVAQEEALSTFHNISENLIKMLEEDARLVTEYWR